MNKKQIINFLKQGLSRQAIADRIGVTVTTLNGFMYREKITIYRVQGRQYDANRSRSVTSPVFDSRTVSLDDIKNMLGV